MKVPRKALRPALPRASHDFVSPPAANEEHAIVSLTVTIDTLDTLTMRRALHRALGMEVGFYVMAVDHPHRRTTLQLRAARNRIDTLMDAIMGELRQAEFGPVTPAPGHVVQ